MDLAGKNILVTGGTGFIGSHLVSRLSETDCRIIVPYQYLDPKSFFFTSERLSRKVVLASCDVCDFRSVLGVVSGHEIDFVYHLAAQSIVDTAIANPLETFQTNVIGTANVLEAARLYGRVKGIIVTSSDKAYGKIPRARETSAIGGDHPYETSKAGCDLIAQTYYKTYRLPVVITRFGNVYGEGDLNFSRIIPGALKALVNDEVLLIRSDGKFVRDYVYVEDIVDALMSLTKQGPKISGEAFNISSKENLSVLALLARVENALGKKISYKITNVAKNEIPVQSINFDKITKLLGWRPTHSVSDTIEDIYSWYERYFEKHYIW